MSTMTEIALFRVGGDTYGLAIEHIREIDRSLSFTPVFNTDKYIEGVINLRGQIVTILNLRRRFGYAEKALDNSNRIIIVNHHEEVVGLLVDSMEDIIAVEEERLDYGSTGGKARVDHEFFGGIYKMDNDLVLILDLEQVLAEQKESMNG